MYQVGECVVYGIHGVCRVVAREQRRVDRKCVTYLALEPVSKDGSRFLVPAHNAAAMAKLRRIYNRAQFEDLLRPDRHFAADWIADDNRRKQLYRDLISGGDREALIGMICCIYRHRQAQFAAGKKIHQCDDNFLRDAERLIAGELGAVMEMDQPEALNYLREKLKNKMASE